MEKTITMSLSEFEKLTKEAEAMRELLNGTTKIGFEYRSTMMGHGWIKNSWNIISKDELVINLVGNINTLESKCNELHNTIHELHTKLNSMPKKSKWF